jgi:DMSO/TMAO reductase YedYZ molybdopterin-dependent catalytic subunit
MRYPWANVALLFLLLLQLVTGYFGFVNGREDNRWLLWLHGIGAYAITVILFWKGQIVLGVYRRGTGLNTERLAFAVMAVLLLATLVAGLLWTFNGPITFLGFGLLTLHMLLAIPLLALMAWHGWRLRWILRVSAARDRRLFLGTAATSLAGLALWWTAGRAKVVAGLLGAERRFTGSYEVGSLTGRFPHTSWIADHPPPIEVANWRLVIEGAVERPLTFTYEQLVEWATAEETATLDCTGGWYSAQVWRGVPLARLLAEVGVLGTAKSVTVAAVSGYARRYALAEAQSYLLALEVGGRALDHGHGFPARLVAPGLRGFQWVKWVSHIRVNESGPLWQLPLPLQ